MVLSAENLSKTYPGGVKAVDHIRFSLNRGEIFGFLGPNGAGKTTTVKLLAGMLRPTEGNCRVLDLDPARDPEKLHRQVGIVTEHAQMYDHLSAMENLNFYGTVFGLNRADCKQRAEYLLRRLGLEDARDRKLSTYSTGMRQRLSLARALMHSPEILFLDEPTSGLDPESAQNVNALIGELAGEGTTVFLCTHQLRYAEEICTSYGLMDRGRLRAVGNIHQLREMVSGSWKVRIQASAIPEGMESERIDRDTYAFTVESADQIPGIVKAIVDGGGNIYQVCQERMTLEDIYFTLINGNQGRGGMEG